MARFTTSGLSASAASDPSPFTLLAVREIILEKAGISILKDMTPVERLRLPAVVPK